MTSSSLIGTTFAALSSSDLFEGQVILAAEDRSGDDSFEAELTAAAMAAGWDLFEDEDGDLVLAAID